MTIAVIGSINVDLFARVERHPCPGETLMGTGGNRKPGGKGANQALAAQLQGGDVRMFGMVGEDENADVALELLADAGVDLSGVTRGSITGLAIICVDDAGENTIVVIPGANHEMDEGWARSVVDGLADGDVVVLQGELPRAVTEAAVHCASERGLRVILNVAPWGELASDVLLAADPLVLNEHEAALASQTLALDADGHEQIAAALLEAGCPSVVVTLGADGAYVADSNGAEHVPGKKVEVVDTTGAGDAFVGTLVARMSQGDTLAQAARGAVEVSAEVVGKAGAQPSYPRV